MKLKIMDGLEPADRDPQKGVYSLGVYDFEELPYEERNHRQHQKDVTNLKE